MTKEQIALGFDYSTFLAKSDDEVLEDSLEYFHVHGWCVGNLQDHLGRVCSAGSVLLSQGLPEIVMTPDDVRVPNTVKGKLARLWEYIEEQIPEDWENPCEYTGVNHITAWNDSFCVEGDEDSYPEAAQQVKDVFAKAAKVAKAGYDPDAS